MLRKMGLYFIVASLTFITMCVLTVTGFYVLSHHDQWLEDYYRFRLSDSLVKVSKDPSAKSYGTGFYIKTLNNNTYILTNKHVCVNAADETGNVFVIGDRTLPIQRRVLKTDEDNDLCLVDSPSYSSHTVPIADDAYDGQSVITIGYPDMMKLTISRGVLIGHKTVPIILGKIGDSGTPLECLASPSKASISIIDFPDPSSPGSKIQVCVKSEITTATTLSILPGASGSPVLDSNLRLVGVVYSYDPKVTSWGYILSIDIVKKFISAY